MKPNLIGIFLLSALCTQNMYAQNICPNCEELKNNIVKITSDFYDGSDEHGFGTVIGERNNKLYVVTAKHVVYNLDDKGMPDNLSKTKSVTVKFFSDQGKNYSATLLNLPNTILDISLLEVEKPANYTWTKKYYSTAIKKGTKVWFIGRSNEWYIPTVPGSINSISLEDVILVDINSVQPGTSGAPLISAEGIAGLIFEVDGVTAKAYPVNKIATLVARSWNYPWQMKSYQRNNSWPGKHEIHAGYGQGTALQIIEGLASALASGLTGTQIDKTKSSGAICLGYRYHPNKRIGLGATGAFENTTTTYKGSASSYKTTAISIMADTRFYYIHQQRFQLFSGLNAGLAFLTNENSSSSSSSNEFAFQLNLLGFRIGNNVGVFSELGFGYRGIVNAGISARF